MPAAPSVWNQSGNRTRACNSEATEQQRGVGMNQAAHRQGSRRLPRVRPELSPNPGRPRDGHRELHTLPLAGGSHTTPPQAVHGLGAEGSHWRV